MKGNDRSAALGDIVAGPRREKGRGPGQRLRCSLPRCRPSHLLFGDLRARPTSNLLARLLESAHLSYITMILDEIQLCDFRACCQDIQPAVPSSRGLVELFRRPRDKSIKEDTVFCLLGHYRS